MFANNLSFFNRDHEEVQSGHNDVEAVQRQSPTLLTEQVNESLADDYGSDHEADSGAGDTAFNREESLRRMLANQHRVRDIRGSLKEIIDAIGDNPSIFSKWSRSWGDMPLTAKIGTGAAVALTPAVAGVFLALPTVIATCVSLGGAYASIGALLEDHYQCTEKTTEKLSNGIKGIVDILELIVSELDQLRHDFSIELDRLSEENNKLSDNNVLYSAQNEALEQTLKAQQALATKLETEIKALAKVRGDLEQHREVLLSNSPEDKDVLLKNQQAIMNNQKQYGQQLKEFAGLLNEVTAKQLAAESNGAQSKLKTQEIQQAMYELFQTQPNATQAELQSFKSSLEMFMNGSGVEFKRLQASLDKLEGDKERLIKQLQDQNIKYAQLNQQHEAIVKASEAIMTSELASQMASALAKNQEGFTAAPSFLAQFGQFSQKQGLWSAQEEANNVALTPN